MDTKKRSIYLDVARVVAIISISLNHAVNRTYANYSGQQAEFLTIPLISTVIKVVLTIFSKLGVPLFLMISGVLLMKKRMENAADIKKFYKHNLLSLFITVEIWYFLMYWYQVIFGIESAPLSEIGIKEALSGMVKTMLFLDQTTFGSMWYMPMILCLYTTLPYLVVVKDKLGPACRLCVLPAAIVFLYFMVLPAVNSFRWLHDSAAFSTRIREANLLSIYYLYLLAGCCIGNGILSKLKDRTVILSTLLFFCLTCAYQFYAYTCPKNYLIDYDFPLLLICGCFLFEWIRRRGHRAERFQGIITYISKISLAIYFLHIIVMYVLTWSLGDSGMTHLWRVLVLEIGSVGLSIMIIIPLSKIPLLRKYLFLIK